MSVCHGVPSNCFFWFLNGIEPFFGHQFSMMHSTKPLSSIFDLGPLNRKIYSPKFGTKSPISRLVWQIDRKCLVLLGFFWGMADSIEPCKMLWGPTLVAMATTFALGSNSPTGFFCLSVCLCLCYGPCCLK